MSRISFSGLLAKDAAPKKPTKLEWEDTPNSTNLLRFIYNPTNQNLVVEFRNDNRRYGYENVPKSVVAQLRRVKSKGTFLLEQIAPHYKTIELQKGNSK
jgi:hypothetical protein